VKESNVNAASMVEEGFRNIQLIFLLFFLVAGCLVLLIIFDIGRSNRYRKELQAAKEEAERLSQVKQQFLSNMSHELRTPLQSVIGFAEQAAHQHPAQPQTLQSIQRSASHLLDVVNEVLDYNRIVSGRFSFSPKPFVLETLLQEIMAVMEPAALKKGLELRLHHNLRKEQQYFSDGFRLRQLLYNLLGNAIKFTSEGYVLLKVNGETEGNMDRLRFEVTDTGIGMSPEQQEVIFNAFEQAAGHIASDYGGTGLGLSIVKALVEQQHGTLELESEPGKGTSFVVTLEMLRVEGKTESGTPVLVAAQHHQHFKVAVIDDDELILQLCGMILSRHHIEHELVHHPRRWLNGLDHMDFTHALIDMRMPVMSGVEVCNTLKERFGNKINVIALTAQVLPEERGTVLEQGFDGLLCKPFREDELLAILHDTAAQQDQEWIGQSDMDLSTVLEMTGGDETLLDEYLHDWHRDATADTGLLQVQLSTRNTAQAREVVHRLAGRVGMLGNASLQHLLRQAETQLAVEEQDETLLNQILKDMRQMLAKVEALMEIDV
jgi:signal transduction histidine kinase/DNA-binding response OmpR family regulator